MISCSLVILRLFHAQFFVIWNAGSQEVQPFSEHVEICSNHEQCEARRAQIKMTKGFVAKEPVKGHMASLFLTTILPHC